MADSTPTLSSLFRLLTKLLLDIPEYLDENNAYDGNTARKNRE
jgi:hypothetical protein